MRRSNATVILGISCVLLLLYIAVSKTSPPHTWHGCLKQNISIYEDDPKGLWSNLWRGIKLCEVLDEVNGLQIGDFANSDETKRHIVPKMELPSVVITLGIGHDTAAETKLIKKLPQGSEFYGADPMHEVNEDLYTKIPGKYFPFAVGSEAGLAEASVLINTSYTTRTVVNVDIIYFLKNMVKRTHIDDIWIDGEGAEYGIFDHFLRGGKFDQNGITFCQFNIEIHEPDELQKKLFHDFLFGLVKDKRYAIFKPVQGRHMRLYMLNFDNEECVNKYIL
ncbi:unnamed protein product [Caenorhabditis sp. 36 PRJEB53466]|nr:unnamed protein product [Caenorhabditis sp. 36 PRJEB53466]